MSQRDAEDANPHRQQPRHTRLSDALRALPNDHPFLIALRTYALSLSFSLGPALVALLLSGKAFKKGSGPLRHVLRREFGISGFAFAMTVGVAGGTALSRCTTMTEQRKAHDSSPESAPSSDRFARMPKDVRARLAGLTDAQKAFASNTVSALVAFLLLHSRKRSNGKGHSPRIGGGSGGVDAQRASHTLDLTLLLFTRAVDAVVRDVWFTPAVSSPKDSDEEAKAHERMHRLTARWDGLVFWASCARIMWCFFYEPYRLPRSYNKWIRALANIDQRILEALRAIRTGDWSYTQHHATPPDVLTSFAEDLGYPGAWGDATLLPAYGTQANKSWDLLGITNRAGVGGIPCELVHGGFGGGSCTANALLRGAEVFAKAVALYLPVHVLPILLTRPKTLLQKPHLLQTLLSIARSATFLSTFVSSIWMSVCLTRTLLLARLLPFISHDFWDGPLGCTFAGSLVCGASIWIEQAKRRGEMTMSVAPRALRALLPEKWLRGGRGVLFLERFTFVLSLATLLTASRYRPQSLRGLSRWTLAFVMHGRKARSEKPAVRNVSVTEVGDIQNETTTNNEGHSEPVSS